MEMLPKSEFSQHLKRQFLSPRTVDLYLSLYNKIDASFGDLVFPKGGNPEEKRAFQKDLNNKIRDFLVDHPRTYYKSALGYYFDFKYGVAIGLPQKIPQPPSRQKNIGDYGRIVGLIDAALPHLKEQDQVILKLYKFYGKRISEILCLKVSKIDFFENTIEWKMKRNKLSKKPMPEHLRELLKDWIKKKDLLGNDDLFYPCTRGAKMREKSKYNRFIKNLEGSDCPESKELKATHEIRRAIATYLCIKNGVEFANAWLDHSSMDTTLRYKGELAKESSNKAAYDTMLKAQEVKDE